VAKDRSRINHKATLIFSQEGVPAAWEHEEDQIGFSKISACRVLEEEIWLSMIIRVVVPSMVIMCCEFAVIMSDPAAKSKVSVLDLIHGGEKSRSRTVVDHNSWLGQVRDFR
jgi:hypothetical protein